MGRPGADAYRLLPSRPAGYVPAPTLRAAQLCFDEHHHRALALLVQSIRQRCRIDLRLVSAFAENLQVEPMPDVVTDLVEALATHARTEEEHGRFGKSGRSAIHGPELISRSGITALLRSDII